MSYFDFASDINAAKQFTAACREAGVASATLLLNEYKGRKTIQVRVSAKDESIASQLWEARIESMWVGEAVPNRPNLKKAAV